MNAPSADRWLFDLGNSRLKFAVWRAGRLEPVASIDHDGRAFASGWATRLPARLPAAYVASVAAPALTEALLDALAARSDRVRQAHTEPTRAGVRIAYAAPRRLGVDRFLALLAARARSAQPNLVVGVGTALTLDLLDADGLHRGGRIAPSPALMRDALHGRAAQLPLTGGRYVAFADDTDDALASGCEGAALGLITGSLEAARALLGTTPGLLLHGGGAEALQARLGAATLAPALVLEGLARWADDRD